MSSDSKATPLILGPLVAQQLRDLAAQALARPIEMTTLVERLTTVEGNRAHRAQMFEQSVQIVDPWPFLVGYSVEDGHGAGRCRHMSMSVEREGRVPSPAAVELVAAMLGFQGGIPQCLVWLEDLHGTPKAVNLLQPFDVTETWLAVVEESRAQYVNQIGTTP